LPSCDLEPFFSNAGSGAQRLVVAHRERKDRQMPVGGGLEEWAGRFGRRSVAGLSRGCLRFAFYGRVSTEDWQDPGSSLVRQREQAEALVRGHGVIVTEFFDVGESRSVAWGRRP
jgi:site-specific DNA recombinase